MNEAKDDLIKLQQEQLERCKEVMGKQRCRIAELEYEQHQWEYVFTRPMWFVWWYWSSRIWPFSLIWGYRKVD